MNGRSASTRRRGRRPVRRIEDKSDDPGASLPETSEPPSLPSPSHQPLILLLRQEYERLKAEIRQLALLPFGGQEAGNDVADEANELVEQSRSFALRRQLEATLAQVEHALQRLEAGTYGLCERCGTLIHPERLMALPYTSLCIGCAARAVA